jgi:uncharacterized protein involved in exopolysaccharide biosynthesis
VRLIREFKVQEALTELLTRQHEIAKITEAQRTSPIQILQKARPPDKKSGPSVTLIVAGASSCALLLAAAAAFVLEHLGKGQPTEGYRRPRLPRDSTSDYT